MFSKLAISWVSLCVFSTSRVEAFTFTTPPTPALKLSFLHRNLHLPSLQQTHKKKTLLFQSSETETEKSESEGTVEAVVKEEEEIDHVEPEDAIIHIKRSAMHRLRELKEKQPNQEEPLVLRMGVRNGGCSGLSYVMDFSTLEDISLEDGEDEVDDYPEEGIKCVIDSKSMLYLYGLELDYSDELIGGGFKFFNPNAEESCGCGSSFAV